MYTALRQGNAVSRRMQMRMERESRWLARSSISLPKLIYFPLGAFFASRSALILALISAFDSGLAVSIRPNILSNLAESTLISSGMGIF